MLLALLFTLLTVFVVTQHAVHGRAFDEWMQDDYGQRTLAFYLSGGKDRSFLEMAPELYMPQHGPAYELIVAAAQKLTGEQWQTRSVLGGVTGLLGILAIALCGREVAGPWGAFLAAAGLALYPRYTGSIFNNSKDIPFTVAMTVVLWLVLRTVRRWQQDQRRFELLQDATLGAAIGFAAAIRVNALAWFAVLAVLIAAFWLRRRPAGAAAIRAELSKQVGSLLLIVSTCYLAMSLTWPYVLVRPIAGAMDAVAAMSKYQWNHEILYLGAMVPAPQAPWHYAPVWLVVGSPLPVVLLVLASAGAVWWRRGPSDGRYLVLAAYVAVPLILLIALRPTLYNSLRQFLYLVPGLILIATGVLLAAVRAAAGSGRRVLAATLVGLAIVGQAEVVVAGARIYPYEYAYFSPVVGGYAKAHHSFEGEYWGSCSSEAASWLRRHHADYPVIEPSFQDLVGWNTLIEKELPGLTPVGDNHPTFLISREPRDGYRTIHSVMLAGEQLCQVGVRSDVPAGSAEMAQLP
ncbi:hypothetical protein HDA40_007458 [Hamadaea flava]|uniref:Glycosyltransferase family 39 protein n=1 Tax=Hamadaea flava TaxID=1742688 RepID=A0ABV8M0P9_9ACTN|nr:glycosyltransferase family 39 protein [Hamadaea flava]MCP2328951.1 hypothetical protein [Hamadaea flava]